MIGYVGTEGPAPERQTPRKPDTFQEDPFA
jgi:hypothetical protein